MIQDKIKKLGIGIAEFIGIATSFLFITGVSYFYGYYDAGLNADWIINLLTTKELLISNIRLGAIVILVFMYLEALFDPTVNTNPAKQFVIGFIALTSLCILSVYFNRGWVEGISYLIAFIAIFGMFYFKIFGKLICALLILLVVPFLNGITAYENKMKNKFPEVTIKDEKKKWLLFDTYTDQAILIDSIKKEKNIRVVPINDLENIKVR